MPSRFVPYRTTVPPRSVPWPTYPTILSLCQLPSTPWPTVPSSLHIGLHTIPYHCTFAVCALASFCTLPVHSNLSTPWPKTLYLTYQCKHPSVSGQVFEVSDYMSHIGRLLDTWKGLRAVSGGQGSSELSVMGIQRYGVLPTILQRQHSAQYNITKLSLPWSIGR